MTGLIVATITAINTIAQNVIAKVMKSQEFKYFTIQIILSLTFLI